MTDSSNTTNPATIVVRPAPKQKLYTRDLFMRDLKKVAAKRDPKK
jgi:hypothetical protein